MDLAGEAHVTSQRKQTHTFFPKLLTGQHVYWQDQGRHALNFKQAGVETAAQEHEQAARAEVHVAVAEATEMSKADMRTRMVLSKIKQGKPGRLIKLHH